MTNPIHSLTRLVALFLLAFMLVAKSEAVDKLRISYSAVNATQAFLWVA